MESVGGAGGAGGTLKQGKRGIGKASKEVHAVAGIEPEGD
jgi:hypothetical protein